MQYRGKGYSVAGLVLGIISCILAWFYGINILALILSIIGIILAVKGKKAAMMVGAPTGLGTAGLVLSIIGLCLAAIGFVACTLCVTCVGAGVGVAGFEDILDSLDDIAGVITGLSWL